MIKWLEYDTDKYETFCDGRDNQHEFYIRLGPEEVEGYGRMWRVRVYELEHIDREMQRADLVDEKFFTILTYADKYVEKQYCNHGEAIR